MPKKAQYPEETQYNWFLRITAKDNWLGRPALRKMLAAANRMGGTEKHQYNNEVTHTKYYDFELILTPDEAKVLEEEIKGYMQTSYALTRQGPIGEETNRDKYGFTGGVGNRLG